MNLIKQHEVGKRRCEGRMLKSHREFIRSGTVKVVIETGTVTQGAGAASAPNVAPIPVTGDPDAVSLLKGGIT